MDSLKSFKKDIFKITAQTFEENALRLFKIQSERNLIYREYLEHLGIEPVNINRIPDIPFLPIEFFKSHSIKTGEWTEQCVFKSSGTTKTGRSQHFIHDRGFYHNLSLKIAETHFGPLRDMKILALLPSYLEQGDSSLVDMVNYFITKSSSGSGFHLHDYDELIKTINDSKEQIMLFGVSYALLDLSENYEIDLSKHIVVETGGMKGRKKEITRNELHTKLKSAFNCESIHTEYGMTELLSQAYGSDGNLSFPVWCKPFVRDLNDPFDLNEEGSGALNIIDLTNTHSCAFIETKDLIHLSKNGQFEVLGRMDNSDIRGCSLLL